MTRSIGLATILAGLLLTGCAPEVAPERFGETAERGLNGTSALADRLRADGHTVTSTVRFTDAVGEHADTVVRFAPYPGPPRRAEAERYTQWLAGRRDRRLVYVPRQYDARSDYWTEVLKTLPPGPDRVRAEQIRDRATLEARRPEPSGPVAEALHWFGVLPRTATRPGILLGRDGEWVDGADLDAAALPRTVALRVPPLGDWEVLLQDDGDVLALTGRADDNAGAILVVADASYLLNGALLNHARRPLSERVAGWIDEGDERVLFVEGRTPEVVPDRAASSGFALLRDPAVALIVAHFLLFALLACLYRGTRLGRPRPAPEPDVGRPSQHAEAVGDLLARTRDAETARELVGTYRRWRK